MEIVDLKDASMPFYDGDVEKAVGYPDPVKKFRESLLGADGNFPLYITCLYNSIGVTFVQV